LITLTQRGGSEALQELVRIVHGECEFDFHRLTSR
jgi:hypothetical protein